MPTVQFLTRTWMAALRDNCFGPQSHLWTLSVVSTDGRNGSFAMDDATGIVELRLGEPGQATLPIAQWAPQEWLGHPWDRRARGFPPDPRTLDLPDGIVLDESLLGEPKNTDHLQHDPHTTHGIPCSSPPSA